MIKFNQNISVLVFLLVLLPTNAQLRSTRQFNQKNTGIKCIYVAIGQKQSTVANVVRKLEERCRKDRQ